MRVALQLCWGLSLVAAPLSAQSLPPDSLFDRLIGRWVLSGTIARQQTTHDVTFEWVLGREYVQMHEVSRERAGNGPAYEAVVLLGRDARTGEYGCLWLETPARARLILQASVEAAWPAIRFRFSSATPPRTVSIPRLSTIAPRIRGSGTWIMIAPVYAAHLRV
jgi:hypothetical protein